MGRPVFDTDDLARALDLSRVDCFVVYGLGKLGYDAPSLTALVDSRRSFVYGWRAHGSCFIHAACRSDYVVRA